MKIEGKCYNNLIKERTLEGEINNYSEIKFTLRQEEGEEEVDLVFEGRIDSCHVHMQGKWNYKGSDRQFEFEFYLFDKMKGTMSLNYLGHQKIIERIEMDLKSMRIYNIPEEEKKGSQIGIRGNEFPPIKLRESSSHIEHTQTI